MRVLNRTARGLLAAMFVGVLFCGQCLAANGPSAGGEAGSLAPIGVVAIKSVDAVAQFAQQLNLPLPASGEMVEGQIPFMPKGSLATDKPLGVVLFGGPNAGPPEARAYVVPVKPGTATLESLKANDGGEAVPGHPDTLTVHAMILRRAGDYLIVGFKPEVTSLVKVESVTDAVKGPDALARVTVNLKSIRAVMPNQFNQMLQAAESGAQAAASGGSKNPAAAQMGAHLVTDPLRKLDRIELALDHGTAGLRLALVGAPAKMPEGAAGKRPDLPAAVIARIDLAGSVVQAAPNSDDWIKSLIDESDKEKKGGAGGAALTPEQKSKLTNLLVQARGLLVGDGGMTAGIEVLGDSPVIYLVNRYSKPVDLATQLPKLVGQVGALTAETKEPKVLDLQAYSIGPTKIFRVIALEHGKPVAYIDAAQRGDTVLMTGTDKPFRCIDRLIDARGAVGGPGAPAPGSARELASGWIDLGALASAATKAPGSPLASMPPEQQKQILNLMQGQRVMVSASAEGDAATFAITLPAGLLQNVPKLVQMFGPGGGPESK